MNALMSAAQWANAHSVITLLVAVAACTLIGIGTLRRRTAKTGGPRRKFSAGTLTAILAFVVCTYVSLNTSYRFTADGLDIHGHGERLLACAAYECLMAMCVFGAREHMSGDDKSPGWYGSAVWVLAVLSSVPAWHEGEGWTPGTFARIVFGSFGAAIAAHSALGLELRHRSGEGSQAPMALILRDLRERLMARMGLTVRGKTAQQIARDRALTRAVKFADEESRLDENKRKGRKGKKLAGKIADALDAAGVYEDPELKETYRQRVAMRQHATGLRQADLPSPWDREEERQAGTAAAAYLALLQNQAEQAEKQAEQAEQAAAAEAGALDIAVGDSGLVALPRQREERADEADQEHDAEAADCLTGGPDPAEQAPGNAGDKAAAAQGSGGNPRVHAKLPKEEPEEPADERQAEPEPEDDEEQAEAKKIRTLAVQESKKAAIQELYRIHVAADDDPAISTNAVAKELEALLRRYTGEGLDSAAAHRAVSEVRPAQRPQATPETETADAQLAGV
ncbi:hypothetical protein ACFVVA_36825 [Kitasatospora sp. NPDC058048]|uniref:hypothetical protein n=1 Tax=Kitasatospora sp. NPDC058048 TaxID=3346313 RepID=UPI0036D824A1